MLTLNSVILFSEEPKKLVDFYERVVGEKPMWTDGDFSSFKVGTGALVIGPHSKVKGTNSNPERIILNLETENVKKEYERIKKLGAEVIAEPYHPEESQEMLIATLADPDGNYFQLVSPVRDMKV